MKLREKRYLAQLHSGVSRRSRPLFCVLVEADTTANVRVELFEELFPLSHDKDMLEKIEPRMTHTERVM